MQCLYSSAGPKLHLERATCNKPRVVELAPVADTANDCPAEYGVPVHVCLQLLSCQQRIVQLEELLVDREGQVQQAHAQASMLVAERDAAARNLLRAEAELNDVSEYSTKMFRQVRG